jgi:hypothetical protein
LISDEKTSFIMITVNKFYIANFYFFFNQEKLKISFFYKYERNSGTSW